MEISIFSIAELILLKSVLLNASMTLLSSFYFLANSAREHLILVAKCSDDSKSS